jgi:hypothetical protein
MKSLLVVACALSSIAFADDQQQPVVYQVPVARIQGNLACTLTLKDQGIDCSAHIAAKGMGMVDMKAKNDDKGVPESYMGMDKIKEGGVESTLMVQADANKAIQGLSLFTASANDAGTVVTTNMMSSMANELQLLNVAPMVIDVSDAQMIKFSINFTVYAKPQSSLVQSADPVQITNLVLERVKPYVLSLSQK